MFKNIIEDSKCYLLLFWLYIIYASNCIISAGMIKYRDKGELKVGKYFINLEKSLDELRAKRDYATFEKCENLTDLMFNKNSSVINLITEKYPELYELMILNAMVYSNEYFPYDHPIKFLKSIVKDYGTYYEYNTKLTLQILEYCDYDFLKYMGKTFELKKLERNDIVYYLGDVIYHSLEEDPRVNHYMINNNLVDVNCDEFINLIVGVMLDHTDDEIETTRRKLSLFKLIVSKMDNHAIQLTISSVEEYNHGDEDEAENISSYKAILERYL